MRFLIYIPSIEGDITPKDEKLSKVGLSALSQGCATIATAAGPDGKPGVVFSWPDPRDPRSTQGYLPDIQEWIPAVERDGMAARRYWVGFNKLSPPTPAELQWSRQMEGGSVVMGDGKAWNIPAAGMLPKDYVLQENGMPVEVVQSRFTEFWERSQAWYDWMVGLDIDKPEIEWNVEVWRFIEDALSLNYMITPEVVSSLRLINSDSRGQAMLAAMGGMQIRDDQEAQKKSVEVAAI